MGAMFLLRLESVVQSETAAMPANRGESGLAPMKLARKYRGQMLVAARLPPRWFALIAARPVPLVFGYRNRTIGSCGCTSINSSP